MMVIVMSATQTIQATENAAGHFNLASGALTVKVSQQNKMKANMSELQTE